MAVRKREKRRVAGKVAVGFKMEFESENGWQATGGGAVR
jgi:hypothetical protein